MSEMNLSEEIARAAEWIVQADGIVITAGAGIGVDSGLPDFRGDAGFWNAYPALAHGKIRFQDIANAQAFEQTPALAWGFYGHRLQLYRDTVPHQGFQILQRFAEAAPMGGFVFTSNVDGQFQRAGFAEQRIDECHGSIHHVQCTAACTADIWTADELVVDVDAARCQWRSSLPCCPHCGRLARPNILMFNDGAWQSERSERQGDAMRAWLRGVKRPVVLEIGAGTAIPSVRSRGESLQCPLIRINPAAPGASGARRVALPLPALRGLRLLEAQLQKIGWLPASKDVA